MKLSEELKYLGQMIESKLISERSVVERLQEIVVLEKDRPIKEMSDLLSRALSGYAHYKSLPCDCGVPSCTYPTFRERHANAVFLAYKATGCRELPLPVSHLKYMKESKEKLAKRKDDAKNFATQNYVKAMLSIKARHQEELKKAEEMK